MAITILSSTPLSSKLVGKHRRVGAVRSGVGRPHHRAFITTFRPLLHRDAGRPSFRSYASGGEEPKSSEMDFDAYLALFAEKFEASENKAVVAGYSVGAVVAFLFIEYFIHLPVFNVLLGFPLQLLGVVLAPYLGVRYFADGKDVKEDIGTAFNAVTSKLPGLK